MNNLVNLSEQVVKGYAEAKAILRKKEYKEALKAEKTYGKIIKEELDRAGVTDIELYGVSFKLTYQDRSEMDEEKLAEILESKGLTDAIIIKKVADPNKLPNLIADGLITDEELRTCIKPKLVPVLKIKEV